MSDDDEDDDEEGGDEENGDDNENSKPKPEPKKPDGLCGAVMLTEFRRQRMIWVGAFLNLPLLITTAWMIVISLSIDDTFFEYFNMIGLNVSTTSLALQVFGAVGIILSFGCFFMLVFAMYYDKRPMLKTPMMGYTFGVLLPILVHFGLLIMVAVSYGASTKEDGGVVGKTYVKPFEDSMKAYKDKIETKATIDNMQQIFECCGNNGFADWFKVQWYPTEFLDRGSPAVQERTKNHQILFEDVPFSCCNPSVKRPCVHHKVYDNKIHFNYDYRRDLTLFKQGCRKEMLLQYDSTLSGSVLPVVGTAFILYILILLIVRFLQTSFATAILEGDPEGPAFGYLIQLKAPEAPVAAPPVAAADKEEGDEDGDEDGDDDEGDDDEDENNANNANRSRNNSFFTRIRRGISAMGGQRSSASSSASSAASSASSSSSYSSASTSGGTSRQTNATLRTNHIKMAGDASARPDVSGSGDRSRQSLVSDQGAVPADTTTVTEFTTTRPSGEISKPKLLDVVRAIARLKASRRSSRTNYSGNCGVTDADGVAWNIAIPSSSEASSRATTVRFAGSETTTFISDSRSSPTDDSQHIHRIVVDSGAGATKTASKTGTARTASKTDTSSPRTDVTSISFTTDTTSSKTGATSDGSMTDTTSSRTDTTSSRTSATSAGFVTDTTSPRTGATSAGSMTGSKSSRTGSTSAGTKSSRTGATSAGSMTGTNSSRKGTTSSRTDATSSGTGATSSRTGATSSETGATSAGSMTDTTSPRTLATSAGSITSSGRGATSADSDVTSSKTDATSARSDATSSRTDATSTRSRTGATSTGSSTGANTGATTPTSLKEGTTTGNNTDTTTGSGIKTGSTTTPTHTPTGYLTDATSGSGIKTGPTTTPTGSITGTTSWTSTKTGATPIGYKTDATSGSGVSTGLILPPTTTSIGSKTETPSRSVIKTGSTTINTPNPTGSRTDTISRSEINIGTVSTQTVIKTGTTSTPADSNTGTTRWASTETETSPNPNPTITGSKADVSSEAIADAVAAPKPTPTGSKADTTSWTSTKMGVNPTPNPTLAGSTTSATTINSIPTGSKTDAISGASTKTTATNPTPSDSNTDATTWTSTKTGATTSISKTGTTSGTETKTGATTDPTPTGSNTDATTWESTNTGATTTGSKTGTTTITSSKTGATTTGSKTGTTSGTGTKTGATTTGSKTGTTRNGSDTGTSTPETKSTNANSNSSPGTGDSLTNAETGSWSGTDTSSKHSKTGTSRTSSNTSISTSGSRSSSNLIGSERSNFSTVGSAFGSHFSGLSTEALTTGSHLADRTDDPKDASTHNSAFTTRKGSHDHRRRSRHHRRRSYDPTRDPQTSPPLSMLQSDDQSSSSSGRGGSGRRSKRTSRSQVPDDVTSLSAITTSSMPSSVTYGHRRRSTKQPVKDDVLVNGEEKPRAVGEITEDYHTYEEIPQHVYEEIPEISVKEGTLAGERLQSDLSTQITPVEGGISEEQPRLDQTYSISPSSNEQGEQHIYEEIPYGDHVNRYRPLPNVPEEEHVYEEIPFGHHLYVNRSLQDVPGEEPIYEEIQVGHHQYNNRALPSVPGEEHIYEEIPYAPEEQPIYEEIPFEHHLYNNRSLPNIPEEEHSYEDSAQSAQVQSGYLQPDRRQSRAAEHLRSQPHPRKYRSAKEVRVHAPGKSSDDRFSISNPELGSSLDYNRPQTAEIERTYTELQDRTPEHSYTTVVSRSSGSNVVSSDKIYQTVPSRQAYHGKQDNAPESVQREPAYTGLQDRRSVDEHTYAVVGSPPSQADIVPQTFASTQAYHERFGSDNARPQNFSSELIFAGPQERRSEHGYVADVSSPPSRSEMLPSNTVPQSSVRKQAYDRPAGTRRTSTQSGRANTRQQDRGSTAVSEPRTDTLPPRDEPRYQGRVETSHGALLRVGSRTQENESMLSETSWTTQEPNQHFYINAIPQAPSSTDVVESGHSLARSISKQRHLGDVSPQRPHNLTQYSQSRREQSEQSAQHQPPVNQIPLQAGRSPHHSLAAIASQGPYVVPGNLISNQPHLRQNIRSEDNGRLVQSPIQRFAEQAGNSSHQSSTSVIGAPGSVVSSQSQPKQIDPQQTVITGGSRHHNRPPVPPKSTAVKEIAKQMVSSSPADPISNQSPQQTNTQRFISEQPIRRNRPPVPPKPTVVRQFAKDSTSTVPASQILDQPQHRPSRHQQVIPENQATTLVKQADRSESKHKIDSPFICQCTLLSGPTEVQQTNSRVVGLAGGINRGQRPLVPPKPTKSNPQYDKHASIKTKLEGIYSRTSNSEPANNYRSALSLARGAGNSAALVKEPMRQEPVQTASKSSNGSSRPSRTLQPAPTSSHLLPPPPPPPPLLPPSAELPIKGILVRRHHSSSALSNHSSSSSESTSSSGLKDAPMTDRERLHEGRTLPPNV